MKVPAPIKIVRSKPKAPRAVEDEVDGQYRITGFISMSPVEEEKIDITVKDGKILYDGRFGPDPRTGEEQMQDTFDGRVNRPHDVGKFMFKRGELRTATNTPIPRIIGWNVPGAFVYEDPGSIPVAAKYVLDERGRWMKMTKSVFHFKNVGASAVTLECYTPHASIVDKDTYVNINGKVTKTIQPGKTFTYTRWPDMSGYQPPMSKIPGPEAQGADDDMYLVSDLVCFRVLFEIGTSQDAETETDESQILLLTIGDPESNVPKSGIGYLSSMVRINPPTGQVVHKRSSQDWNISAGKMDPDLWLTCQVDDLDVMAKVNEGGGGRSTGAYSTMFYSATHDAHDYRTYFVDSHEHLVLGSTRIGGPPDVLNLDVFAYKTDVTIMDPAFKLTLSRATEENSKYVEKCSQFAAIFRYYKPSDGYVLWNCKLDRPWIIKKEWQGVSGEEMLWLRQTEYYNNGHMLVPISAPVIVTQYTSYYGERFQASLASRKVGPREQLVARRIAQPYHMLGMRQTMTRIEEMIMDGTFDQADEYMRSQILRTADDAGFWDFLIHALTVGIMLI